MKEQINNQRMEECPECMGTGKISAQNCSSCDATGQIIIHSHTHRHDTTAHDHPHHHAEPHHPDSINIPHDHRH